MPYVERVTKAGNTIEIERYFTSRYKRKESTEGIRYSQQKNSSRK